MKTSTKLLIAFVAVIILSFISYNYLLKRQYAAGNFVQNHTADENTYVKINLPEFSYVVIDGKQTGGKGDSYTEYRTWMPHMSIKNNDTIKNNFVSVLSGYQDILQTKVKNDTLYVSFFNKRTALTSPYRDFWHDVIEIKARKIKYISGRDATFNYYAESPMNDSFVTAATGFGIINLNNLQVTNLQTISNDDATINIEGNNNIGALNYNLYHKGILKINPAHIREFKAIHIDSLSKIIINGNAPQVNKYLTDNIK